MSNPASRIRLSNTITCCHHCVPPKRHTACWGHCPEYLKQRAEQDARNAENSKQAAINWGLKAHTRASVKRARKGR